MKRTPMLIDPRGRYGSPGTAPLMPVPIRTTAPDRRQAPNSAWARRIRNWAVQ